MKSENLNYSKRYKFSKPFLLCGLTLFFLLFLNTEVKGQKLKSSYVLDTTKTQIFPYDYSFNLRIHNPKKLPIKYVYLYRLNNKGKVTYDKNTSLLKIGWSNPSDYDINQMIKKDSAIAGKRIFNNKSLYPTWKDSLDKKKKELNSELITINDNYEISNKTKVDKLKQDIKILNAKINAYKKDEKTISEAIRHRKKLIKKKKSIPIIRPLTQVRHNLKDTIIVKIPELKPNKRYIIVALDNANKISVLERLIKNYKKAEVLADSEESLIPYEYLPDELKKEKFIVPSIVIKEVLGKAQTLFTIKNLLKTKEDNIIDSLKDFTYTNPGPYKYDSLMSLPKDFNKDFRKLNSVLVSLKSYGNKITYGDYNISLDSVKENLDINFNPKNDLDNRLANITNHLQLVTNARQSLFLLGETNSSPFNNFDSYLDNLIGVLSYNRKVIDTIVKGKNKLNKDLNDIEVPIGLQTNVLEKNTISHNFLTRNSRFIKPDFGMLFYTSNDGSFSGFAPFTGFHVDIRSTNENVLFSSMDDWKKYFTFQFGVPLFAGNLTEGESRKHLIGNTFSLYGGIGVNFSHTIRASYGAILFRSLKGNINGVNSYKITSVHAFSLGINLKLKTLFEAFYGAVNSFKQ